MGRRAFVLFVPFFLALPAAAQAIPTAHTLNEDHEQMEATGAFATVQMPGLAPGTQVTVTITVPDKDGVVGTAFRFAPVPIDPSGILNVTLPQLLKRTGSGEVIDLSLRRYRFDVLTDDGRFATCPQRGAVMIEGRKSFTFRKADKVFCAANTKVDTLP